MHYIIFDKIGKSWDKTELYISYKIEKGNWTKPKQLGSKINATKTESYAFVSVDGKYLFFRSMLDENGGGQDNADIWWINRTTKSSNKLKRIACELKI